MSRYALFGVKADSTFLGDLSQVALGSAATWLRGSSGSEIYSRFQSVVQHGFPASFATGSIEAALTAFGCTGANIGDITGGLVFQFIKRKDGGSFWDIGAANSYHRTYSYSYGYIFPQTLTVKHRGDAVLTYGVLAKSNDGTTSPLLMATGVDILTTKTAPERFAIGDAIIENKTLTQIDMITFDFGLNVLAKSGDDRIYDVEVNLHDVHPTITFSGDDLTWADSGSIPTTGLAFTHANTSIDLRKRADGGDFQAEANDITFSAKGQAFPTTLAEAEAGGDATAAVQLQCDYDGTNAPLTVTL